MSGVGGSRRRRMSRVRQIYHNTTTTSCLYISTLSGGSRERSDRLRISQEFTGGRGRVVVVVLVD